MKERYRLFAEAANTVTQLDWLQSVTIGDVTKTRVEHYGMQVPKFAKYLRTWGEAGTVKSGKVGKLGNRGITMMMVGYANYHEGDVYRMLNLETGRVTETRAIIWLLHVLRDIKQQNNQEVANCEPSRPTSQSIGWQGRRRRHRK